MERSIPASQDHKGHARCDHGISTRLNQDISQVRGVKNDGDRAKHDHEYEQPK